MNRGRHHMRHQGWPARRPIAGRHAPRGAGATGCLRRFRRSDVSGSSARGPDPSRGHSRRAASSRPDTARKPCSAGARQRVLAARLAEAVLTRDARPMGSAGAVLGFGLGALLDGIVLGDLFQVHHLLPGRAPAVTLFWDGVVQASAWLAVVGGLALLFRAARWREVPWSGRILLGAMMFGWGLFNALEGLVGHHVLRLHHLVEGAPTGAWDWAFLAVAVALMAFGWSLTRAPVRRFAPARVVALAPPWSRRA